MTIRTIASTYLATSFLTGCAVMWMTKREMEEHIKLFSDDPAEEFMMRRYQPYGVCNFHELATKPHIQKKIIRDKTLQAAGMCLMWPLFANER